ncbi:MAG: NADH-quinone oxidoreductase subunit N, partial [Bryocella sp.]
APGKSRKPLGWVAIFGLLGSMAATLMQHHQVTYVGGTFTGFYNTVQIDGFSIFFHLLIASVAAVVLLASLDYFAPEHGVTHAGEYFALVCFGSVGMMLMTCSIELLMVFIGLEISSISTYILAGFRKGRAGASEASLKYFLLGSFATAFFLYGIALTYGATGSTAIGPIAAKLAVGSPAPGLAILAVAMVLIGMGFKVSAAPFHVWTPDVYQGAPSPVIALMSTGPKAAAFAVLLRFLFNGTPMLRSHWTPMIAVLAVLSMTIGNLGALLQKDVKRMLAYSSIAHAGYLLVAFTAIQTEAVSGVLFYAAAYTAMNAGAMLVVTLLSGFNEPLLTIEDFTGVALKKPYLAALMGVFMISLIGIPFTGGFFGKFYIFTGAIHNGYVWLAVVGLANSGVACFYYLRFLVALYSRPVAATPEPVAKLSIPAAIAVTVAAVAVLALGIFPNRILHMAQSATPYTTTPAAVALPPIATTTAPQ